LTHSQELEKTSSNLFSRLKDSYFRIRTILKLTYSKEFWQELKTTWKLASELASEHMLDVSTEKDGALVVHTRLYATGDIHTNIASSYWARPELKSLVKEHIEKANKTYEKLFYLPHVIVSLIGHLVILGLLFWRLWPHISSLFASA